MSKDQHTAMPGPAGSGKQVPEWMRNRAQTAAPPAAAAAAAQPAEGSKTKKPPAAANAAAAPTGTPPKPAGASGKGTKPTEASGKGSKSPAAVTAESPHAVKAKPSSEKKRPPAALAKASRRKVKSAKADRSASAAGSSDAASHSRAPAGGSSGASETRDTSTTRAPTTVGTTTTAVTGLPMPVPIGAKPSSETVLTQKDVMPLEVQEYYHGLLPRLSVGELLCKRGDFLVRSTEVKGRPCYVISARWKKEIIHTVMQQTKTGFWHVNNDNCFYTIPDLILYYTKTMDPIGKQKLSLMKPVAHQSWQLNNDQMQLGKRLGQGAYGEVFTGTIVLRARDPPTTVAVKTLKGVANDKEKRAMFIAEAKTMRDYTHPNIVRLIGIATQKEPVMIVMEYCPNGSLRSHLKKGAKIAGLITAQDRLKFCLEAANGLAYLEKKHCVHRDVAARNCLLDYGLVVKISDFGLAAKVKEGEERRDEKAKSLPVKWLAPETLTDMKYSHKSDVWAYGVLVYEVYADGSEPYKGMGNAEVRRKVTIDGYRLTLPNLPDPAIKHMAELVADCWQAKPENRPTFKEIVARIKQIKRVVGSERGEKKARGSNVKKM